MSSVHTRDEKIQNYDFFFEFQNNNYIFKWFVQSHAIHSLLFSTKI